MSSPTFFSASLLVALGGGVGAWLRFVAGRIGGTSAFPWATLSVNVLGSLAMGLLAGWLARHGQGGEQWRLLLGVGLLGGFTTFSAFSLELAEMIQRGSLALAASYALVSVLAGIGGLFLGLILTRVAA
jgi:fluoride exporter